MSTVAASAIELAHLGTIRAQSGDIDEAISFLRRACDLSPGVAGYHNNLALALTRAGEIDAAVERYHRALALEPDNVYVLVNLGRLLRRVCLLHESKRCFIRALRLHPEAPELKVYLADTFVLAGEEREAESLYGEVIAERPQWTEAHYALSNIHRFESEGDPELKTMLDLAESTEIPAAAQCSLQFALGKAYDDLRLYDLAFAHYQRANELHVQAEPFDPEQELRLSDEIIDIFKDGLIESRLQYGLRTRKPVFIIGLPRAGKTLLEQHLACYRGVHSGGESAFIRVPHDEESPAGPWRYPHYVPSLTRGQIGRAAEAVMTQIERVASEASYVTNTMPGNFATAGLIRILFPDATIIHCVRDAVDTCLSCYFKLFMHGWAFTYDLRLLGRYYASYERLMHHWRATMPGPFIEVRYEDLIDDPETTVRTVAAHCGLADADRIAPLPPVHKTESERWRPYAAHLAPLLEAMGPGRERRSIMPG
jgi:tetratricopeptide (TPR) repeat protein